MNGTLKVTVAAPPQPVITSTIIVGGTNLVFGGTNGSSGGTFAVLTATDILLPLSSWTTQSLGNFQANGSFSVTNAVDLGTPKRFFRIKTP